MAVFSNAQFSTNITKHTKKQGYMAQPEYQNESPETNPEEIEINELPDKELKITVLKMLNEPKEHRWKTKQNWDNSAQTK